MMVYEKYRQEYASAANDSRVAVRKMIGFFMVVSPVCRHGFVMVPCLRGGCNTVFVYSGSLDAVRGLYPAGKVSVPFIGPCSTLVAEFVEQSSHLFIRKGLLFCIRYLWHVLFKFFVFVAVHSLDFDHIERLI